MLCIDFGSGYSPRKGYKTCDFVPLPSLDYYYNGEDIIGLETTCDRFLLRNVIHHLSDITKVVKLLKTKLHKGGRVEIIECRKEYYKTNDFLDSLWYNGIVPRKDITWSKEYRDYKRILREEGFKLVKEYLQAEKEVSIWEKN